MTLLRELIDIPASAGDSDFVAVAKADEWPRASRAVRSGPRARRTQPFRVHPNLIGRKVMATNPRIKPIERATNRTWDEWLRFMERIDAKSLDHHSIAVKVFEELDGTIDQLGWWTRR